MSNTGGKSSANFSRRTFVSAAVAVPVIARSTSSASAQATQAIDPRAPLPMSFKVNGELKTANLDVRTSLLDALRETIGLTGTKKGCDHGQCGACTVLVNGRRVLSCLTLAVTIQDQDVTTIEGLAKGDQLHPMQQAFMEQDAFQCGYCTPGQIISAVACVKEGHANSDAEIREYMSGNICRCAAYPNIVAAINQAKAATLSEG